MYSLNEIYEELKNIAEINRISCDISISEEKEKARLNREFSYFKVVVDFDEDVVYLDEVLSFTCPFQKRFKVFRVKIRFLRKSLEFCLRERFLATDYEIGE